MTNYSFKFITIIVIIVCNYYPNNLEAETFKKRVGKAMRITRAENHIWSKNIPDFYSASEPHHATQRTSHLLNFGLTDNVVRGTQPE